MMVYSNWVLEKEIFLLLPQSANIGFLDNDDKVFLLLNHFCYFSNIMLMLQKFFHVPTWKYISLKYR